jgi:O-acetyl-ADP-ribose deacetylase (regulator of RNase III)/transposase InsO family protein
LYSPNGNINEKVSLWQGDITCLEIDSIVNAANQSLLGGGGVDGAIHSAAGPGLLKENSTLGGCVWGDAKMSGGYRLPAKNVISTVGPTNQSSVQLKSCYKKCLGIMESHQLRSIALPCIATGLYGFPKEKAASIALETVREFMELHEKDIDRVIFCVFSKRDLEIYQELLPIYFPLETGTPPITHTVRSIDDHGVTGPDGGRVSRSFLEDLPPLVRENDNIEGETQQSNQQKTLSWEVEDSNLDKSPDIPETSPRINTHSLPNYKGTSMILPCRLFNREISAVIDTAAQVSVVSQDFIESLENPPILEEESEIKGAGKQGAMKAHMLRNNSITINNVSYSLDLCVAPITDTLLLGIDFLAAHESIIDMKDVTVKIADTTTPATIKRNPAGDLFVKEVQTSKKTVVQPSTVHFFQARIVKPLHKNTSVVFQPHNDIEGLQFPAVLTKNKDVIPLHVINLTECCVTIPAFTTIGTVTEAMEIVEEACDTTAGETLSVREVKTTGSEQQYQRLEDIEHIRGAMPEHLTELYKRSCRDLSEDEAVQVGNLLLEFQDIFSRHDLDIGCFEGFEHSINTGDNQPIKQRLRRTPLGFEAEEEKHLNKLLDQGIITHSNSAWSSPPVLVRKKDGSVRYCLDYRVLNSCTTKDSFPIPSIDMCLDTLAGSRYFSTLDLASGYYNLKVKESDRHKTAFSTKFGTFEYIRLPFGLCNAPATFQRAMELALRGLTWKTVLAYLDDVIVLGKTFTEHLGNLREVFLRMRQHNLKLKPSKCTLFQLDADFLGKSVSSDGVNISSNKLDAIKNWPVPANRKELESFIGYVNYHRDFVRQFSKIVAPLLELNTTSKKNHNFYWGEDQQLAFDTLKSHLSSAPCLSYPRSEGNFILDTDASDVSIGAELSQIQEGKERTIAYASNILLPAQRRYCVTRKELLAVVKFTRQFRHYLLGRPFLVRTDHSSLAWLMRFKEPIGQLARWLEELQQYNMTIIHRAGKLHTNADALSRIPSQEPQCDCYRAGEFLEDLPCGGCSYCKRAHTQWARFAEDVDDILPLAIRKIDADLGTVRPGEVPVAPAAPLATDSSSDEESSQPNWMHQFSDKDIRSKQLADVDLHKVMGWLENGEPSSAVLYLSSPTTKCLWLAKAHLHLDHGILYYQWEEDPSPKQLLVIPEALKQDVLSWAHDKRLAGHLGRDKTLARVRQSCYWYHLRRDVSEYTQTCSICNRNKHSRKKKTGLQLHHAGYPMERVHIDILGPFTPSDHNNVYVLSMIDQFSKWIECAALPEQTAQIVAEEFLTRFITTFGCPLHLHSDQGRQFEGRLFQELCRLLEITKTRTTPYHPSGNGQVERYNQVILQMIRCFIEDNIKTWDDELPLLTMALHATVHRQTGFTPNRIMLGREVLLPLDLMLGTYDIPRVTPPEWVQELGKRITKVHHLARESLQSAQARQKKDYDVNLRWCSFQPGDLVYKVNDATKVGVSRKLCPPWAGPYLVTKSRPPIYKIRFPKREGFVHADKLKPCRDRSLPGWLKRARHEFFQNGMAIAPTPPTDMGASVLEKTTRDTAGGMEEPSNPGTAVDDQEPSNSGTAVDEEVPSIPLEENVPPSCEDEPWWDSLDGQELPNLFNPRMTRSGRLIREPEWYTN